jgi:hypothetical protein
MIAVPKLVAGSCPRKSDGISNLQFLNSRFKPRAVVPVSDDPINGVWDALKDSGPRVQHHIMSLVSLGGNQPRDGQNYGRTGIEI